MELVSAAHAAVYDKQIPGENNAVGPPGAFRDEQTLLEEWVALLERICESGEVLLGRWKGDRDALMSLNTEEKDARIITAYKAFPDRFVVYVEDVPEESVRGLRRRKAA